MTSNQSSVKDGSQRPGLAYASQYIKTALHEPGRLSAPDTTTAGEFVDVVVSLWEGFKANGSPGVNAAWSVITRMNPHLKALAERKLIHADQLVGLSKPVYLVDGYPFFAMGMNIMVGASGGGKSFIALDFAGRLVRQGKTIVYIAGEGLHGYASRWECLKPHLGIDSGSRMYFYCEAVQVMDETSRAEFINQVNERGIKPDLIVVDTLARCSVGIEENSNKEMGEFIAAMDALKAVWECGVLIVHHTGKDGHTRGASALIGACDASLMVSKQDDGRIKLSNQFQDGGKNKHDAEQQPRFVQLLPRTVGEWASAVVVDASSVITEPTETGKLTETQRAILEALDTINAAAKVKTIADVSQRSAATIYRVLKELVKVGYVKVDDDEYEITSEGKNAFYKG